jgi:adenylate cyclase class 2
VSVETELKIPVSNLSGLRSRLEAAGYTMVHPAVRETNDLLDTVDRVLTAAGRVLRMRTIGDRHLLTFKGPARYQGRVKHRLELELEVGDRRVMLEILQALGFRPVIRYEKDRETWRAGEVIITLDHTPMGDFVELEGAAAEITGVARTVGLDPAAAVLGSYVSLWQEYRRSHPGRQLPNDMVFDR